MAGRDCEHGSLARVCGICERDAEIARLRKAIVFAIRNGYAIGSDGTYIFPEDYRPPVSFDGTDESLIATVCRLAEGE